MSLTEPALACQAKRKLAVPQHVAEVRHRVAATCRYYGINQQAHYEWRKRFEEESFDSLRDCSRLWVLCAYPSHHQ